MRKLCSNKGCKKIVEYDYEKDSPNIVNMKRSNEFFPCCSWKCLNEFHSSWAINRQTPKKEKKQ